MYKSVYHLLVGVILVLTAGNSYSQDEKELVSLILKRLHFDSLSMTYTSKETRYDQNDKTASETVSHVEYRSKGDDFFIRSECTRVAIRTSPLSKAETAIVKLGGTVPPNKAPVKVPLYIITSFSFTEGKWKQLIEAGDYPLGAAGIRSRRGIYGDKSLALDPSSETPNPWQFWQRVGNSVWHAWYKGTSGMPLEEFLRAPGKSRVWGWNNCVVLTHQIPVPEEIDGRKEICLDIYVDEEGIVRRIDDVNRVWHLNEQEWAAIPGLGSWGEARQVLRSVAFEKVEEDRDSGVQIPLTIRVSVNGLATDAARKACEKWLAEGRSRQEIPVLTYTVPSELIREYDISVDLDAFRINPPLRIQDIELTFPQGTDIEGAAEAGVNVVVDRPWHVRHASLVIVISAIVLITIGSIILAKYLNWR